MIRLRPYEPSDAQAILSWIHNEISFRKWCADRYKTYPISAYDMNKQYEAADQDRIFPMTAVDESGIIGHLIMRYTDDDKLTIRFGFVIVDDKKRHQGIGRQMLESAIDYAFLSLKADHITLGVFENNLSAYHCYRSVGFREVKTEKTEYYHIFDEDWKCLEMELRRTS